MKIKVLSDAQVPTPSAGANIYVDSEDPTTIKAKLSNGSIVVLTVSIP